jgi:hypothetical protein
MPCLKVQGWGSQRAREGANAVDIASYFRSSSQSTTQGREGLSLGDNTQSTTSNLSHHEKSLASSKLPPFDLVLVKMLDVD